MAQQTVKIYANKWAYVDSMTPIGVIDITGLSEVQMRYWYGTNPNWNGSMLFVGFESFPQNLDKKRIYYATAKFAFRTAYYVPNFALYDSDDFDPATLEWSNKPQIYGSLGPETGQISSSQSMADYTLQPRASVAGILSQNTCAMLRRPAHVLLNMYGRETYAYAYAKPRFLANGSSVPYIEITYDDAVSIASKVVYASGPVDGYANPREAQSFSWNYVKDRQDDYDCVGNDYDQSSAVFYWKNSEDDNYTSVSISGNTKSVTIPANTFPANKIIEWYISGTDDGGTTSQTEVFSFNTSAGTAYATAKKPISTVEDGAAPITFEWEFSSTDGQEPSGVDLWWKLPSEANNEWHTLLSNASPVTRYSVAAGTFPAGEIQWIVRAYNIDGTAGPWSQPASGYYSFICMDAPDPPGGLNATEVPLTTISWQSAEQQGYEISIDGKVVRKAFGAGTYNWKITEPLPDGEHVISVRVLGAYGFWSQPSTVTITVTNTPPAEITLNGIFDLDAYLAWEYDSDPGSDVLVQVYRDNKLIGISTEASYSDLTVLGTHSYYVILKDENGNYSQSNTVTGTMHTDVKMIAPLDGSAAWLALRLSENSADTDEFNWTQMNVTQHVKGAVWPQIERSTFQDMTASFNCAFINQDEIRSFEALRGKIVIVKCKNDNVVVGMLAQLERRVTAFYTAYNFTLQQIHVMGIT